MFAVFQQEKPYARLFWAGLISGVGDRFHQVAMLGLLLSITGSGAAVGIAFGVRLLPYLLFGPLGGALADRFARKRIMIATDCIRITFALLPLLVKEPSDVWMIYAASFLLASGEAVYTSARMSSIPLLVQPRNLLAVNGLDEAMTGIVLITGSVSGGIVSAVAGVQAAFVLNALSFLVSALLISRMRAARETEEPRNGPVLQPERVEAGKSAGVGDDAGVPVEGGAREADGLRRLVADSPYIGAMLIVFALWPVGGGIFNILLSVYAVQVFHMGDVGIGLFYGALGIGMLLGSAWAGRFSRLMKAAAVLALFLEGAVNMMISQAGHYAGALALLAVTACCGAVGNACNRTILMNAVPKRYQGRFFGFLATLQNSMMGVVMLLAGFSLDWVEPRTLGLAGGGLMAIAGAVFAVVFFTNSRFQH